MPSTRTIEANQRSHTVTLGDADLPTRGHPQSRPTGLREHGRLSHGEQDRLGRQPLLVSWAASHLEPRNGGMSEVLMVGNDSHIGSPQLFGPGLSRKVRNGGSSLLTSFGDPSLVQAVMFALGGA